MANKTPDSARPDAGDHNRAFDIDDVEDYVTRERLKAIHEARERVPAKWGEAYDAYFMGRVGRQTVETVLRHAVEQFLAECWNLLRQAETEVDYLDAYDPPRGLGVVPRPGPHDDIAIRGLRDYHEFPDPMHVEWTETENHIAYGTQQVRRSEEVQLPEALSMRAYMALIEFLGDVNFAVEVDRVEEDVGILELEDLYDGLELPEDIREKVEEDDD